MRAQVVRAIVALWVTIFPKWRLCSVGITLLEANEKLIHAGFNKGDVIAREVEAHNRKFGLQTFPENIDRRNLSIGYISLQNISEFCLDGNENALLNMSYGDAMIMPAECSHFLDFCSQELLNEMCHISPVWILFSNEHRLHGWKYFGNPPEKTFRCMYLRALNVYSEELYEVLIGGSTRATITISHSLFTQTANSWVFRFFFHALLPTCFLVVSVLSLVILWKRYSLSMLCPTTALILLMGVFQGVFFAALHLSRCLHFLGDVCSDTVVIMLWTQLSGWTATGTQLFVLLMRQITYKLEHYTNKTPPYRTAYYFAGWLAICEGLLILVALRTERVVYLTVASILMITVAVLVVQSVRVNRKLKFVVGCAQQSTAPAMSKNLRKLARHFTQFFNYLLVYFVLLLIAFLPFLLGIAFVTVHGFILHIAALSLAKILSLTILSLVLWPLADENSFISTGGSTSTRIIPNTN
mmetsp:Transcript_27705/g.44319  ORF Transcript_27705/g.44319 Transcript_27705/m.44319 type:complete len:469 (+) Transcript_27705:1341-2747(+)